MSLRAFTMVVVRGIGEGGSPRGLAKQCARGGVWGEGGAGACWHAEVGRVNVRDTAMTREG